MSTLNSMCINIHCFLIILELILHSNLRRLLSDIIKELQRLCSCLIAPYFLITNDKS